jgi:hypothetical protein
MTTIKTDYAKKVSHNMFALKILLKRHLDGRKGIRTRNKDRVLVVTGEEGLGKSNLILSMFDYWYKELLGMDLNEDLIKYLASNKVEFVSALKDCSDNNHKYFMVAHDEAGKDLYARKAMSDFSSDLNILYMVIRGMNLYTILAIPSILDLDTFFRTRRVKSMVHFFEEGKYAYYSKKKIARLVPHLKRMKDKNENPNPLAVKEINPDFVETFEPYTGPLMKTYLQRKTGNMSGSVGDMFDKYVQEVAKKGANNIKPEYQRYSKEVYELREAGNNWKKIKEMVDLDYNTLKKAYAFEEKKREIA